MLLAVFVASCSDYVDVEEISPSPLSGNQGAYFPATNTTSFELEPTEATEIRLTVARTQTSSASSVPIIVETNTDNVFNVPQTVSFASGAKEATFTVTFPTAGEGTTYSLKLALEGEEYVDPYGEGMPYMTFNVTRIKWTPVEEPMIYVDGLFAAAGWGVKPLPVYIYAEKAQLGASVRYRFNNVYKPYTNPESDEDGVFDGFYNNAPGFDDSKDWPTVIEIHDPEGTSGKVSMPKHPIGVEWSKYGPISIGSAEGEFGKLANNVITFPKGSLLFYDNGGSYGGEATIYMTKEAFIAANLKITDFNKVEYEQIDGEVGEYESAAYTDTWNRGISKAIDIDSLNEESEYKNLYYLPNLYADDYGLAFYYDEESGKVTIPKDQPIGTKVFGNNIYVSPSEKVSSSVEETLKGVTVYTLGLTFHFKDGTLLGDFAEKFYYKEDELVYEKEDFLGSYVFTGPSLFTGGSPANMKGVEIKEGPDENTFIITGIKLAKEIVATFDPNTSVMSIAPQVLADIVAEGEVFDVSLLTFNGDVSDTAVIDLAFTTVGILKITDESDAFGYVIYSSAAGGLLNGFYNFIFTPVKEEAANASAQQLSSLSLRSAGSVVNAVRVQDKREHNFSIQGKRPVEEIRREFPADRAF